MLGEDSGESLGFSFKFTTDILHRFISMGGSHNRMETGLLATLN